jgi:hypothetical protein
MRKESRGVIVFHFPFSILRLSFAIAGKADRSTQNEHWATSDTMTNDKRKMENGK